IDLCAEPGSNYIGFVSISNATRDMQLAIWDGTDTSPFNFQYTFNNADTNAATWSATTQSVACGWAGSGANRRAVFVYRDVAATTLRYYTWVKSSTTWEPSVADAPATYSPPMTSGTKNFIYIQQAPDASDKIWVSVVDSNSDLWTFTYNASNGTAPSSWLTIDDGRSGNYAVEANLTSATGPSGGLAITSFDPTLVELISFKAETEDDEAIISWRTASELRTIGFRLYRTFSPEDRNTYEEITTGLIHSRGNPYSGREYRYVDKEPLKEVYYILEEILANGSTQYLKPVRLDDRNTFLGNDDTDSDKSFLNREGNIILGDRVIRRKPRYIYPVGRIRNNLSAGFNPLKIELDHEGLYRITSQDLINAGWNISELNPRSLAIFNQGREIPIYVSGEDDNIFDTGDFIEFYGQKNLSRYTSSNVYWLTSLKYKGLRMKQAVSGKFNQELITTYQHGQKREEDVSYYAELKGDEHWFFAEEFISPASFDFQFYLDHIANPSTRTALLEINLQGASRWGFGAGYNLQRALIYINNNFIGKAEWTQDVEFSTSYQIPINLLKEGKNILTIKAPDEEGGLLQFFLLNWFKVTYPKRLVAEENRIIFDSGATQYRAVTYKVEGFTSQSIRGLVIKNERVLRLQNLNVIRQPQGDYAVIFGDNSPEGARYILYADTEFDKPLDVYPDIPSNLRQKANQADYLIITHAIFKDALKPLVDFRRGQGLSIKVVDVEDIYDEFNYGIFSPLAIKDFLSYAYHNWQASKPLFVLLIGDATFDYQDFWHIGKENLVPAYLIQSPDFGETVSDNWFVDFDEDTLPEMFIGRLPVNSTQQLEAIIDKIISYENSTLSPWTKKVLFVSDNEKQFENISDRLFNLVPSGYQPQKVYLSVFGPDATRQRVIEEINKGSLVFNYAGHSGITLLAQEMIFRNEDIRQLQNTLAYPLFLSLNCMTGYFIYPEGLDSLSETLLNADKKGIIAAISPSGLSSPPEQYVFMEGLYKSIFETGDSVLGAVHFKAKGYLYKNASLIGSSNKVNNVINIFNLLGDPALLIRRPGASTNYSPALIRYLHRILEQSYD
ncbi:MAG: C25 family cysteine peptidase, partial [Candidatus Omnitrophica bacterium]|nr:C25 family cysteine peptidase [Candidatus Omnitrophota bacterium]